MIKTLFGNLNNGINLNTRSSAMRPCLTLLLLAACTNPDTSGSGGDIYNNNAAEADGGDDSGGAPVVELVCNDLQILPTSIQFGEVKIGETGSQAITVYNNSDEGCDSLALTISISGDSQFTSDKSSMTLTPGSNDVVWATFEPDSIKAFTATMAFTSTEVSVSAPLTGTGYDTERCDGADNDGDGVVDNNTQDSDSDGTCDELDPCPNGDQVCDQDGDGFTPEGGDCDDADPATNPDAPEVCDELDNNCDGQVDEGVTSTWYTDSDGDGFGDPATGVEACSGDTLDNTDCLDTDNMVYPGAVETWYDGVDQDCDEASDYDQDLDGFDSAEFEGGTDCLDTDNTVYPEAPEIEGDGVVNDCDAWGDSGVAATTCWLSGTETWLEVGGTTYDADWGDSHYTQITVSAWDPYSYSLDSGVASTMYSQFTTALGDGTSSNPVYVDGDGSDCYLGSVGSLTAASYTDGGGNIVDYYYWTVTFTH